MDTDGIILCILLVISVISFLYVCHMIIKGCKS